MEFQLPMRPICALENLSNGSQRGNRSRERILGVGSFTIL